MSDGTPGNLDALLSFIKHNRGFDFAAYKPSSLQRRINKRIQMLEVPDYATYISYLEAHPGEYVDLFNTILINVTGFFRDAEAWQYLDQELLPTIIETRKDSDIRVWCAGVASGQEAYSIAMLLAEALGAEQLHERVKIYATDLDDEALAQARAGAYRPRDVAGIPEALLDRYFEQSDAAWVFRKELRRALIFGRHDLLKDPPISRIDLLICRNTLMYFNLEAQNRLLSRFQFALRHAGFLFLGRAEMLFTHSSLFSPVDIHHRIFKTIPRPIARAREHMATETDAPETSDASIRQRRFRDVVLDAGSIAEIAVDANGFLASANERARLLLNLNAKDQIGLLFRELDAAYRLAPIRNLMDQATRERRHSEVKGVEWITSSGEVRYLDMQVSPLIDSDGAFLGTHITFEDVTRRRQLERELAQAHHELETAYEELQSSNEELQTTNEELQSTVEELETTNEELQSTNEELETMNEELESTNSELETTNTELRLRSSELDDTNAFLESILGSLNAAVVVLDSDLRVQVWNHRAEDMWGLRRSEVQGKHLMNLDIGLPVDRLHQPMRNTLAGSAEQEVMTIGASNRRGKPIDCQVTCLPRRNGKGQIAGVTLLMDGRQP